MFCLIASLLLVNQPDQLGSFDISPTELGWAKSNFIDRTKLANSPFNTVYNSGARLPNQHLHLCAALLAKFPQVSAPMIRGGVSAIDSITLTTQAKRAPGGGRGIELPQLSDFQSKLLWDNDEVRRLTGNVTIKGQAPYQTNSWGHSIYDRPYQMMERSEDHRVDDLYFFPFQLVYLGQDPATREAIILRRPADQFVLAEKYNWSVEFSEPYQLNKFLLQAEVGASNVNVLTREEFFRLRAEGKIPQNILEANVFQESWGYLQNHEDIYLQESHNGGSGRTVVIWNRFYRVRDPQTQLTIGWIHRIKRHDTSYYENSEIGYRSHGARLQRDTEVNEFKIFEARYDVLGHRIGDYLRQISNRQLVEEGEVYTP